jgi:3-methylcrotonyl-CoA carboxylase alpha subunit
MSRIFDLADGTTLELPVALPEGTRLHRTATGRFLVEDADGVFRPIDLDLQQAGTEQHVWWTRVGATSAQHAPGQRATLQRSARAGGGGGDDRVRAPMTGKVVAVPVAVGQQVARGDVLVVVEAMKMEQPLEAPMDGRVAEVRCAVGDQVDGGVELVILEAVDEA